MLKKIIFCHAIFFLHIFYICQSNSPQNHGEFRLRMSKVEICKGPKRNDCCNITVKVENGTNLIVNMVVKENFIPKWGKITLMMDNKPLVRLQMKKPCDHLFMMPLFQKLLNATKNCQLKKGQYNLNIDIDEVARKYYDGMFLYGNFTFKPIFYNEHCNFFCAVLAVTFMPKNNV